MKNRTPAGPVSREALLSFQHLGRNQFVVPLTARLDPRRDVDGYAAGLGLPPGLHSTTPILHVRAFQPTATVASAAVIDLAVHSA